MESVNSDNPYYRMKGTFYLFFVVIVLLVVAFCFFFLYVYIMCSHICATAYMEIGGQLRGVSQ